MTKKILVLNECNSSNLGDQAIADAVLLAFHQAKCEVVKQDFSCSQLRRQSRSLKSKGKRRSILKSNIPRFMFSILWATRNIKTIKLVASGGYSHAVIGGGQLILSNVNFPYALFFWSYFLKKNGVSYTFFACGAGESFKLHEKLLIGFALRNAKGVFLRDMRSVANVSKNFGLRAELCPDAAYYLESEVQAVEPATLVSNKCCAICITAYSVHLRYAKELGKAELTLDEYIEEWLEIAQSYHLGGYRIVLLATTSDDVDLSALFAAKIRQKIPAAELSDCCVYAKTWRELVSYIKMVDILISGRMHALILAQLAGVKIIPYEISKKISGFSEQHGIANISTMAPQLEKLALNMTSEF
jgi:polysaccharide pyruvyl transferase WcaK-like protein